MNDRSIADAAKAYNCPPILFSPLYREPGTGDAVVAALEATNPESAALARAFLLYYRGDIVGAEAEANRALTSECRFATMIGVSHVLSLSALLQGDTKKWDAARTMIVKCDYANNEEYVLKEVNLAAMDSSLFVKTTMPQWLREGCFDPLPVECYATARFLYAKLLYMEARLAELAAVVEPMISQSHAEKALLSEVYLRIIAAMGLYGGGESKRAERHLRRALELALPDKLYSPFAEYRRQLGSLLLDGVLKEMDPEALGIVIDLNETILAGWTKLYNALYNKKYTNDLTAREYDAARFAMLGLTNGEIAGKMGVSVNAVKLYLRNVYEKLGINRRDELAPYIWEDL